MLSRGGCPERGYRLRKPDAIPSQAVQQERISDRICLEIDEAENVRTSPCVPRALRSQPQQVTASVKPGNLRKNFTRISKNITTTHKSELKVITQETNVIRQNSLANLWIAHFENPLRASSHQ
jgi:hypothetical protein